MSATTAPLPSTEDYRRVERTIEYLEENFRDQPRLDDVAAAAGLSPYHFQRLFRRWVGVSPKRFLQYLTKEHAKELLARSATVLDATWECGLSAPSRLHDLMVTCEAVTPGERKREGEGVEIRHGVHPTPFGPALLAATSRGVCHLSFLDDGEETAVDRLAGEWPEAELVADPRTTAPLVERIFARADREPRRFHLHLRGTNFQIQVWQALLAIPPDAAVAYGDLARLVGRPGGARAVGQAVGRNPLAFIVPCHRVLRRAGDFGGYRYGSARKKAILAWEAAAAGSSS